MSVHIYGRTFGIIARMVCGASTTATLGEPTEYRSLASFARAALVVWLTLAACTRPNPNVCCTDSADCAAAGIPEGSTCKHGLVCRGNQCIAQPCTTSNECDETAPYCVLDDSRSLCAEACTDDSQCPGFSQTNRLFCEAGDCVECRVGNNTCPAAMPICDQGVCRTCTTHAECPSNFCNRDGGCLAENEVSYVESNGSTVSNCTRTEPCTLARANELPRTFIVMAPGAHSVPSTLLVSDNRWIVGLGTRPTLTRTAGGGAIIDVLAATLTIENVEITGGVGLTPPAYGINCYGAGLLDLTDTVIARNDGDGLMADDCEVRASRVRFTANERGVVATGSAAFDRCQFDNNRREGVYMIGGVFTLTNSFVFRNVGGVNTDSATMLFNTIVDNSDTNLPGVTCANTATLANNIIARNAPQNLSATCSSATSIVTSDISGIRFKSPDLQPFDYHLMSGSSAIDQVNGQLPHDFDGHPRPTGGASDVGADEVQ